MRLRRVVVAWLGTALAVVTVACGSSGDDSGDAGAATQSTATSAAQRSDARITREDVAVASAFVGGRPGRADASEKPFVIGLAAPEQGPVPIPYLTTSAQAAVKLVNEHLGGVGGRPVVLDVCPMGASPEQGQACGQRFANDPAVQAIVNGGVAVGAQQLLAANDASKPLFCPVPTAAEAVAENAYCPNSGPIGAADVGTYLTQYADAESVSFLTLDIEEVVAIAQGLKQAFENAGLDVTLGLAQPQGSDVTSAVLAAKVQSSDSVFIQTPLSAQCLPFAKALEQLSVDKPVVALPGCATPTMRAALGDLPRWTYYSAGPRVDPADPTPEARVFLDAAGVYGDETMAGGYLSPEVFATILLVVREIGEAARDGEPTPEAVAAKTRAFRGPMFLGDPQIRFGTPPFPAVGTLRARFYTYLGDGRWEDATGGQWVGPPAGGQAR